MTESLSSRPPIHPVTDIPARIADGEDPWYPIGCFLHDWWYYAVDRRAELVAVPPSAGDTEIQRRWAAFCAATVEELCRRTRFPVPAWVFLPVYVLDSPWFLISKPSQQEWLRTTSPDPFKRRNVFAGAAVLDNKYEVRSSAPAKPRWQFFSEEDLKRYHL